MAEPQEHPKDFSIIDASEALEGLLARDESLGNEEPEEKPAGKTAEPPETPEEVKEPPEGEEAETEQEVEPEEEQTQEPLFTVKIDGEEKQVALKELQSGYSGQQWITKRSQQLAAEKKEFEAERAAVKQERAQYAEYLGKLTKSLENGGEVEPDWDKLRAEDEFKFLVEHNAWQVRQGKLQTAKAEQARLETMRQQDMQKAQAQRLEEENRKALDYIPAWKDEVVRKKEVAEVRAFALKGGWTEEEIDSATDARAVRALYAEYTLSKLANTQRPRPVANRGPRSASPGAGSATPGRPAEITRLKQRLAQTGDVQDAADIFLQQGVFE